MSAAGTMWMCWFGCSPALLAPPPPTFFDTIAPHFQDYATFARRAAEARSLTTTRTFNTNQTLSRADAMGVAQQAASSIINAPPLTRAATVVHLLRKVQRPGSDAADNMLLPMANGLAAGGHQATNYADPNAVQRDYSMGLDLMSFSLDLPCVAPLPEGHIRKVKEAFLQARTAAMSATLLSQGGMEDTARSMVTRDTDAIFTYLNTLASSITAAYKDTEQLDSFKVQGLTLMSLGFPGTTVECFAC